MGKILAVCSGSGGAGKSTIALSLAALAAKQGKRAILLDASGLSRSCDLMMGLESIVVLDMLDVAKQQVSIQSALYPVPKRENMQFACSSLYEGTSVCELSGILLALRAMCDFLIIDMPTGQAVLPDEILAPEDKLILLAVPNDASLRALERMVSGITSSVAQRCLILNHIKPGLIKKRIQYDRSSVEMLLDMPVCASILEDERIETCAKDGKTAIEADRRIASELSLLLADAL